MKTTSKLAAPLMVMMGIFALAGVSNEPADRSETPAPAQAGDHHQLQLDADMTQRMSTPSASGPMQDGTARDPQLDRSTNAIYLAQLEQHQRDIQRMLATAP